VREETLVFFETARRLAASLADLAAVLGARRSAIGRELTKAFEEVIEGDLVSLAARFASSPDVKGEIVIAVAAATSSSIGEEDDASARDAAIDERLRDLLARGCSVSTAARQAAAELGTSRRDVYRRALTMRSDPHPPQRSSRPALHGSREASPDSVLGTYSDARKSKRFT
jgi:16S rRNA (cytidine1402-2'-O)-methyltransferase